MQGKPYPPLKWLPRALAALAFLLTTHCGDAPSGAIDIIESERPDRGLNEDLPEDAPLACLGKVITESSNLNVRTTPEISNNICGSLPSNSYVTVLDPTPENGFYLITSEECSEDVDQFVSSRFIELGDDCETSEDPPDDPPNDPPPGSIENLGDYIESTLKRVSVVRELIRGGAKGRVTVYKVPGTGENILCGSKHIRSYRSEPFLGKDTLCAWTAVLQEWRQRFCPNNDPHCRIMAGDHTFGERLPSSWPHSTHRRGWCMDIWPMRDEECGEREVTWKQSCYNRGLTRELVELMVKHGADKGNQLFFNDPQIPHVRPLRNHDDHIHVCFKPSNRIVQQRCDSVDVDTRICPEFPPEKIIMN